MNNDAFSISDGLIPRPLTGLSISATAINLPSESAAAEQFSSFNGIAFDRVLEPSFREQIRKICGRGKFTSDQTSPGHRETESPQVAGRALNLALSRASILRWLEAVTQCGPLQHVDGRVVRTLPRPGDELRWHDDLHDSSRRLAIVINLGVVPFAGGEFELRQKGGLSLLQHRHGTSDSMLVFKVSPTLEHRVLPLQSGGPRLVYTGWALAARSR